VRAIDVCLDDLAREDGPALNAHAVALFSTYVEHCGNPALVKVCSDVTDGLAYKLRVPNIVQVLHWDSMAQSFVALRRATEAGDPIAAESAAAELHALPGPHPLP
jgi:DNA-binding FadR family transcriptional regulator